MACNTEIVNSLIAARVVVHGGGYPLPQSAVIQAAGHPSSLRLFSWNVTDNGAATGTARPPDELRIQAIGSSSQQMLTLPGEELLVLGWWPGSPGPLIVAFNPSAVAARVNSKIQEKINSGDLVARVSDSQQFKASLIGSAFSSGIAVGTNQYGENIVAMRPDHFMQYLSHYKSLYH